jgi:hypothetical protein
LLPVASSTTGPWPVSWKTIRRSVLNDVGHHISLPGGGGRAWLSRRLPALNRDLRQQQRQRLGDDFGDRARRGQGRRAPSRPFAIREPVDQRLQLVPGRRFSALDQSSRERLVTQAD